MLPMTANAPADALTALRIVIPVPPGPLDVFARIVGDAVLQRLKRPVLIENRPGAGGNMAAELGALSKRRPLNFASSGSGTPSLRAFVSLQRRAGLAAVHIPYKGASPAMNNLLGGHVDAMFAISTATIPPASSDRLRGLAYSGKTRSLLAPDVPTLTERGL
jgi:tripartite-type tricarboxylate transporter receptor subunit TctC